MMTMHTRPQATVRSRRGRLVLGLVGPLAMVVAACASDPETSEPEDTVDSETTSTQPAEVDEDLGLEYVGGTAGPADESLDPVVIGWVNEQGGQISLPYHTQGVEAAVAYVNAELGGVQGHPVELRTCFVASPPDGQRCGTEMVNDADVDVILTGVNITGGQQLYSAVAGRKPVLVGLAVTPADTTTEGVTAFTSGVILARGMSVFVDEELEAENVALLYADTPSGRGVFSGVFTPILQQLGVNVTGVPVPSPPTGPAVQQALLAAGAEDADAILLFLDPPSCGPAYDGIRQSGVTADVVATEACSGTQMTAHLEQVGVGGDVPDGWYFVNNGAAAHIVDDVSGMAMYLAAVEEYQTESFDSNLAYYGFSNLLTTVRLMNELGVEEVDPETFQAALLAFNGPAIMFGGISCPGMAPNIGLCGKDAGVIQYTGGEWITHRWGPDLIDTREV